MKKWMLFLSLFMLVTAMLNATNVIPVGSRHDIRLVTSSTTGLTLHYDVDKIESYDVMTKGGTFSSLAIPGYTSTTEVGNPALPLCRKLIQVPLNATVDAQVISSTSHEYSLLTAGVTHQIMPAQESVSKSADPSKLPFIFNSAAYMRNEYTNSPLVHVEEIGIMRGVRVFAVDYVPVQYDPSSKMIKVWNNVDVKVTFHGGDLYATEQMRMKTYSPAFESVYQKSLMNFPEFAEMNDRATNLRYPLGYLIITDPAFSTTMASFVTWKKQQGYNVTMVTTATTGTTTSSIKAYIQSIWDNATALNPAPSFLLLVGDTPQIPAYTGQSSSGHVTDLDYVKLNGTDYVPEMYYGRFSVTTAAECQNIIDKTLMFEKTTMPSTAYLGNVDMIAGQDPTYGPTHGDGQINYGTTNYFNATHGITSSTYLYAVSGSASAQIIADCSAGRGYMNYTAHGSETGWYSPAFSNSDVDNLTNANKYPVMVGNCCLTNHFDTALCFGEKLIRAANKGAVAYIGGTNSTYWDEDYWWGVGAKLTSSGISSAGGTAPAWVANKIGAYDAVFHQHSEATADWATSTGAMIYMGNLAVTQAASSRIFYYWEIYSVMGDPSLSPYMGVPATNSVTAASTITLGATTYSVTAAPYSLVCLSMGGTIYGVGTTDASGALTMTITPFSTPGSADLVVTCQNKVSYIGTVTVIAASGPYMTVDSNTYSDSNNNTPEYNETGRFTPTFKNVGTTTATNTVATLSTSASGITITDNTETIASLAAGASSTITNAYTFTTANNMVDQTVVPFHIAMVGSSTWTYDFNKTINAPALAFGSYTITDTGGNGNGQLDPGETVTITVPVNNAGHAASLAGSATLTSPTTGITVTGGTSSFSAISASGSATATFTLTVGSSVAVGTVVTLNFAATAGAYTASNSAVATVGIAQETFETGNLNSYAWTTAGATPYWSVVNTGAYAGTYCAKSGAITSSQSTDLKVSMVITTAGTITYCRKVSSESGYDYMKFYIDDVQQEQQSGEVAWAQANFAVTAGTHTFKWTYVKDGSVNSGSDCAWIDNIIFPPTSGSVVSFDPPQNLTAVAKNGAVTLTWTAPASGTPASYKVYRGGVAVASSITGLTYTNTGLTNGTSYSFYVTAVYTSPSVGESPGTSTVNATPIAAPPTSLMGTGGNNFVNLNWTAPTNETPSGYKVYRNSTLLTVTPVTGTTYTDNTVTNGTSYAYYVTSVFTTPAAESAASNTVNVTPSTVSLVTIGTDTTTQAQPLNRYYNYSAYESIYLQSEIGVAGMITSMGFYKTSGTDVNPITNVSIYMQHTTATTLAAGTYSTTGYTLVYTGSYPNTATSGWMDVTLTTPFTYNNTNNLQVLVVKGNQSYISSPAYPLWNYTTTSTIYRARYNQSDSSAPTSLTESYNRSNIKLSIAPPAVNPTFNVNPTTVPFGSVQINTTTSATTLTVTNTGSGSLTISSTVKTGTDAAQFTLTDSNTYPKVLTSGQSMTVTVAFAPNVVGTKSASIRFTDTLTKSTHDVTLTGTCYDPTITTFPFSESFDSATFPPLGWTNQRIVGTSTPGTWDYQTAGTNPTCTPHTGAGIARYNAYSITANTHAVVSTPSMNIPGNNYRVSFWVYRDASSSYNTVKYSDEGISAWYGTSPTDTTLCTYLGFVPRDIAFAPTVTTAGWYQYSYLFGTGSQGNGKYVIFKGKSQFGDNIFMDDVVIDAASTTPVFNLSPANLDFGTVTTGSTATKTFTISNTGGQNLSGTITTPTGYTVALTSRAMKNI
ncbi:MAG TPA: C25 family cysteine peptidase, partial [Candidatus Cloacimonadota bacterium]|nr:C25 family cysteine peptidase [Candidatus Cloacimonadota bacterium]